MSNFKSKIESLTAEFNKLNNVIFSEGIIHLSLKLILIVLLLYMNDNTYLLIFMPIIIIPGLLFNKVLINKYYWLLITLIGTINYLILDLVGYVPNHKHIFAYVLIAITLTLFFFNPSEFNKSLKIQGRYIIGLCFLFATIGKFLAPAFLDGTFFEFTNISDPRFFGLTSFSSDIPLTALKENENNFMFLLNSNNPEGTFKLNSDSSLANLGMTLSYWTIFIEGMIAISFCIPEKFWLSRKRDLFLAAFIITTYPIATVAGFAIILTALGFMQSIRDNKITRISWFYLLVFIFLPLVKIPFARVFSMFL